VTVEGVVIWSDVRDRCVKLVRDEFHELNREQFGQEPEAADTGAEWLVATYCTSARIRSQVRTLVVEEGREFGLHLTDDLYSRVVEDIWAENWQELMRLDREAELERLTDCYDSESADFVVMYGHRRLGKSELTDPP
jgi:hypothetical protein